MAVLQADMYEQILLRLDVRDLIRCKSVCKSWHSLISSPRFVKDHLNHSHNRDLNDNQFGHRRILISSKTIVLFACTRSFLSRNGRCRLLGSSNGLVCISIFKRQLLIANPSTRQVKKLRKPQLPNLISKYKLKYDSEGSVCWGFGYDSSIDDYKVIVGFMKADNLASFKVLNVTSNVWKVIGELRYSFVTSIGVLCNGALHWLMINQSANEVIVSFDLSKEEFREMPIPDVAAYQPRSFAFYQRFTGLGIMEGCLCIFHYQLLPRCLWRMNHYNVNQSWRMVGHDWETKNDVVHFLRVSDDILNEKSLSQDISLCKIEVIIGAPIFVESLVSPIFTFMGEKKRKRQAKNSKKTVKECSNYALIEADPSVAG